MLNHDNSYLSRNGAVKSIKKFTHAEIILSSKAILTHFGITLYEGLISKCRLLSLNPSEYHSRLSDFIMKRTNLINLGEYYKLNITVAKEIIKKVINSPLCMEIDSEEVYCKTIEELDKFIEVNINLFL